MKTSAGTRKPATLRHWGWCQRLGRLLRPRDAAPPSGCRRFVGLQRPGQGRRRAALEVVVVVQPAQRIAQLAPARFRTAVRRVAELAGRGAVGMVAQHRIAEGGAQLGGRGGRLGAQHLVVVALLGACLAFGGHPARIRRPTPRRPRGATVDCGATCLHTERPGGPRAGHLLIIGGAEDKLRQRQILSRFASLAGGADARVAVISTASSLGDEATELYQSLFRSLGIPEVRGLRPIDRGTTPTSRRPSRRLTTRPASS